MSALFATQRLLVRRYGAGDAAAHAALAADPAVRRFSGWSRRPDFFVEAVREGASRELPDAGGWINLAVEDRATGALAGDHAIRFGEREAMLGLAIAPARRREGLGRELLGGSLAWLRAHGVIRIGAEIDVENAASLALFRRCGFAVTGAGRDALGPYAVLAHEDARSRSTSHR